MERFRNSDSKLHKGIIRLSKSELSGSFLELSIEVSLSFLNFQSLVINYFLIKENACD